MVPISLSFLEDTLSYSFTDQRRLLQALTHKSYTNENKDKNRKDNERFELLGDAVLDLVICQHLIEQFPELSEGDLSMMKAKIVSEETLAEAAKKINLGAFLFLGRGEEQTDGQEKPSLLADALEALIAAIYLDAGSEKGLPVVRQMILSTLETPLNTLSQESFRLDHKTVLQEYSQKVFGRLPTYEVMKETGPDHEKRFEVKASLNEEISGIGIGKSKKAAEQKAAQKVLSDLKT